MHILTITTCDKSRPPVIQYIECGMLNMLVTMFNLSKSMYQVYGKLVERSDEEDPDAVYYGKIINGLYVPYLNVSLEEVPKEKNTSNRLAAAV